MWSAIRGLVSILFLGTVVFGADTFYVAKTGTDEGPCTKAMPCQSINRGITRMSGGDTLIVHEGVYKETFDCKSFPERDSCIPGGTDWTTATRIVAAEGEVVKIKPKAKRTSFRVFGFSDPEARYIILDGLIIDATAVSGEAVKITSGASHIRLVNCEIRNSSISHGVLITNGKGVSEFNEIINCRIHDNGNSWVGPASPPHNIYLQTGNNLVDGCDIFNSPHGVAILHFDGGSSNVFRNNVIHENLDGIILGGDNDTVYNNVFYSQVGIDIKLGSGSGTINDIQVYNNTCYDSGAGAFVGVDAAGTSVLNAVVKNNIFFQREKSVDSIHIFPDAVGTLCENNLVRRSVVDAGRNATLAANTAGDPAFVNPENHDYHLTAASSGRNRGTPVDVVKTDKDGVSRPQEGIYDIGAYEFVPSPGSTPARRSSGYLWFIGVGLLLLGVVALRWLRLPAYKGKVRRIVGNS
jgi:hypothetical protein